MKVSLLTASLLMTFNVYAAPFKEVQDLNQFQGQFKAQAGLQVPICSAAPVAMSLILSQSRNDQTTHFRLQSKKGATSEKFLSMTIEEAGGEVLKNSLDNLENLQDNLTASGKEFLLHQKNKKNTNCRLIGTVLKSSQTNSGLMTLSDGQIVKAQRAMSELSGNILCDGRIIGAGTMQITEIQSQECDKTTLIQGTTLKLAGKTIQSFRTEVLSISKDNSKNLISAN